MQLNKSVIAMSVIVGLIHSANAVSVEQSAAKAKKEESSIERISVTATKRYQPLIDVPMSVSAIGEEKLEEIGADNFDGYVRQIPGLSHNSNGGNSAKFSIRGVTTSTNQTNTQAPVSLYQDELPLLDSFSPFATPDLRLFDVNRVEVLRGPQGTLFGSGALGGAIRVITNKPNVNDFEAKVSTTIVTIDEGEASYDLNAMVNLPLIDDELALRAVIYSRDGGGYVDNLTLGEKDVNSRDTIGGRVMLTWNASDDLSFLLNVVSQDDSPKDRAFSRIDGPAYEYDSRFKEPLTLDFTSTNLLVDYEFDSVSLTSSSTFSSRDEYAFNDVSGLMGPVVSPFGITSGVSILTQIESETFAQEVRLTSNSDSALEWLIGAFYIKSDRDIFSEAKAEGLGDVFTAIGLPTASTPFTEDALLGQDTTVITTETAFFGEATYFFNDELSVTLGARWFENTQELKLHLDGILAGPLPDTDTDSTESSVTPKFSISYKPNNDLHYYASATKGYRVGQSNFALPSLPGEPETPAAYGSDSLWNYEIGVKSFWLDGDLDFEVAAYFIDWQDIQLTQRTPVGFQFIDNAGEATSKGAELSLSYSITNNMSFGTSIGYNDTELTSVNEGVDATQGDELPGAAKLKLANNIKWTQDLGTDVIGYIRLDHQYSSDAFSTLNNATSVKTDSYNVFNVHVGATFDDLELVLFVKNISKEDAVTNVINGLNGVTAIRLTPQEIGLTLRASF